MRGSVPKHERNERSRMLHILSDKKRRAFYEQNIGKEANVIFENDIENGLMHGFTENYVRVGVQYDPLLIHESKHVKLTGLNEHGVMLAEEAEQEIHTLQMSGILPRSH